MRRLRNALAAASERGLVVSSCHPRRFDPPFVWARDKLARLTLEMGQVLEFSFDLFYHRPSKQGLPHGLLIDHVGHELDLMHWMLGYEELVAHRLYDSDVRYAVAGVRKDQVVFNFRGARTLDRKIYGEQLRIRFERGELQVDTETGIATSVSYETGRTVQEMCGKTDYELRFGELNRNFALACRGAAPSYLSELDIVTNSEIGIMLTPAARQLPGRSHGGLNGLEYSFRGAAHLQQA